LVGELGAGKTCFVRGLARGLGIDAPEEVRSPTWMLMLEYEGPVPLLHLDAYFEGRTADFLEDGLEARLAEEGVLVVEWGEKLRNKLPGDFLQVYLEHVSENKRLLRFVLKGVWADRIPGDPLIWSEGEKKE
jgi:tRNA threonylcarbamoyladenosine biosynthesis protein TsaE